MGEMYQLGAVMVSHLNGEKEQFPLIVTRGGKGNSQEAQGVFVRPCPGFPFGEPLPLGGSLVPYTGELSTDEIKMAAKALLLYA